MRPRFSACKRPDKTDFSITSSDTEELIPSGLNDEVNYRITAAYAQQMQDCVLEILSSCGYPDCEIDLLTDIDESGGIFIKRRISYCRAELL